MAWSSARTPRPVGTSSPPAKAACPDLQHWKLDSLTSA
jgi:hypothetical protein